MSDSIIYTILGDPIPLARARHAHRRTYDSQKQLKMMLGIEIERQHAGRPMYSGPLEGTFTFFFGFPENMSDKKKAELVGKPHIYKPDTSNLQKLIEDICSKLLYPDDCLLARVHSYKVYDYIPRTEFFITEIK